ncbi:MAG: alpha/beta hydrolase [Clostridia bacterium]|nr:alpha/beta hydrolase [Clostridia bacterium]
MFGNARNGIAEIGDTVMRYASFGTGKKALVLLPGLSDGLATVQGKAALLAGPYRLFFDRYTVYLFSRKEKMPAGYSIRGMAEDQATVLKTLGIDRACVMGVSQGGMIAQYLAIDHPERVEKLVLAVTAPCSSPMIAANVSRWVDMAQRGAHRELMIDTAENSYSEARLKKMRKLYPLIGLLGKPKTYERFFRNADAILQFDALSDLEKIPCPTLILAGEQDRTVGVEASHILHNRIANSDLFVYPGLGHAAFEEAPDFNRRVFDFLESN